MKAAVIHRFGDLDVFKYEDVETPTPRPGHILTKVLASGVNRLDHYIREGSVVPQLVFPHILGADAAGEVADLGEGVTGFELGERVVPLSGYPLDEIDYDIYPNSAAPSYIVTGLQTPGTFQVQAAEAHRLISRNEVTGNIVLLAWAEENFLISGGEL